MHIHTEQSVKASASIDISGRGRHECLSVTFAALCPNAAGASARHKGGITMIKGLLIEYLSVACPLVVTPAATAQKPCRKL